VNGWASLERFLNTDPRDVGCEEAIAVLHLYCELILAGQDPGEQYPGVVAHLIACGPCSSDFDGLLAAVGETWSDLTHQSVVPRG
jgi:hypothetical protein